MSDVAGRWYVPAEVRMLRAALLIAACLQVLVLLVDSLRNDGGFQLHLDAALALAAAGLLLPAAASSKSTAGRRDAALLLCAVVLIAQLAFIRTRTQVGLFAFDYWSIASAAAPALVALVVLSSADVTRWSRGSLTTEEEELGLARNRRIEPRVIAFGTHVLLAHAVLLVAIPVLWVLDTALSPGDILSSGGLFEEVTGAHFANILGGEEFWLWLRNSVIVAIGTTILGLMLAIPAAYAFSRYRFKGHGIAMFLFLLVQMFPGVIILVPYFMLMKSLGLLNTSLGLILAYSVTALPLCVWMLKGFFDTIPRELEEAALLDGCSQFDVFARIILPLSLPAVAVTALFSFLAAWNEFLLALTFNTTNANYTLPVGLASLISESHQAWGDFAAMSLLVSIPVVVLFIAFQKFLIQGLTAGGVKG